jgi:Pyruvate/2-oxoacid:ferredoxin oxidoreductase delta subunit
MGLFKEVKKPVIRENKSGGETSTHRPAYIEKSAPCIAGCTIGNHVRDWIVPLAQHQAYGRSAEEAYAEAWRAIAERNPLPAISGRVCQHPCESSCNRKAKDSPVAVHLLERFIGDFGISHNLKLAKPELSQTAGRVAVVGAGPSGLSCAYRLVQLGYTVALFDAATLPGGMIRYQVPRETLPLNVIDPEIQNVLDLGIEFHGGCVVGKHISADTLLAEYRAVIYAVGLQKSSQMQVRQDARGALVCGELPAEAPVTFLEPTELIPRTLNMITPAIAQGRRAAEDIDAALQGKPHEQKVTPAVIKADRMRLEWYPSAQRHEEMPVAESGAIAATELSPEDAIAEAARCMSCGMCMDCETCWMYCSNNCFVKLPKGEHYKIRLDLCNGCGKCIEACPCGFIEAN